MKNLLTKEMVSKIWENLVFFQGKSCYLTVDRRIRLPKQESSGILPG
jgi:hypothetical protein